MLCRAGIKPVDHSRHNKSTLRQQSEANRERKLAEAEQVAAAAAAAEQKVRLPVVRRSRWVTICCCMAITQHACAHHHQHTDLNLANFNILCLKSACHLQSFRGLGGWQQSGT